LLDQPKRKIDDLFPEYDIKLRNWILESLREDLTLYNYLISPSKENDSVLGQKHIAESIAKLREFVKTLWPKKKKGVRMLHVDGGWLKTKDEKEISRDKVRLTEKKTDHFYKILK
jgi:hypothetical protein